MSAADRLPPDLRAALLGYLDPAEELVWTGQPTPPRSGPFTLFRTLATATNFAVLALFLLLVGAAAFVDIRSLWTTFGPFGAVALLAIGLIVLAIGFFILAGTLVTLRYAGSQWRTTVYAVTTTRVLGFVDEPREAYCSWEVHLPDVEVKVRGLRPDGVGDLVFPGMQTRGWAFEGDTVFSRIPGAESVTTLIRELAANGRQDPVAPQA